MKRIKGLGQVCVTGPDNKRFGPPSKSGTIKEKPEKTETPNVPSDI